MVSFVIIKLLILSLLVANVFSKCENHRKCKECIKEKGCLWCNEQNIKDHCISSENINSCTKDNLINPQSIMKIIQEDGHQIKPREINLSLRKGESKVINFTYMQRKNYPVDLYFLMDLSASMKYHKEKLSNLASTLSTAMKELTNEIHMGFGSFVDKVEMPFINLNESFGNEAPCENCVPAYVFKNHLSLTTDVTKFSETVKNAGVSGNRDAPEGGLEALLQAMVCQKEIGWRKEARHLLIFSTDDIYHIAGDGKLAGIVKPNDGKCHLANNNYTHGSLHDYPSIGQIDEISRNHSVIIIFAVTPNQEAVYKDLSGMIKDSKYVLFSEKSDEIVDLIKGIYSELTRNIKISSTFDKNFKITFSGNCTTNKMINYQNDFECIDLHDDIYINFQANITLTNCPDKNFNKTYLIRASGLDENIKINLQMLCDCPCEKTGEKNSPYCNENGELQCGICECNAGKIGNKCECNENGQTLVMDGRHCKNTETNEICSGLGKCICEQCVCHNENYGKFCECNDYSCKKTNNQLCSNHGECKCGVCECVTDYKGDACECPIHNRDCTNPTTNQVCSNRGDCKCGKCECTNSKDDFSPVYSGEFCDKCIENCLGQTCDDFQQCVDCKAYESGSLDANICEQNCSWIKIKLVDNINEINDTNNVCVHLDEQKCSTTFKYLNVGSNSFLVYAKKTKDCIKAASVYGLLSIIAGTILLATVICLLIWKSVVTVKDRREYEKFENEKSMTKFAEEENPLYKNPKTEVQNPLYGDDRNL